MRLLLLPIAGFLLSSLTAAACAAPSDDDDGVASTEAALGECTRASVTATAGLNLRSGPSTTAEIVARMPFEAVVDVLGKNADGSWANVRVGSSVGWASAEWLACAAAPGACTEGDSRHAYVHAPRVDVLAEGRDGANALFTLPYGQKVIVEEGAEGERAYAKILIPSLVDGTDRVEGFVAGSALQQASRCRASGLRQKDRLGATHLLGQATITRAASADNAKNMILGFNRVDGAVVGTNEAFTYLEYVADNNRGTIACTSDADCDGEHVCNQRGLCGPYFYGIGGGGGELWGSGVCGTATAIHRAVLDASLLPTAYTNHDAFISTYEYVGADAEVWWSNGAPGATGQHYRFFNDSGGSLVLVASSRARGGQLEATVQIWGTKLDDRYSEHEVVDLGGGRVELRRKLTRVGGGVRVSPRIYVEGTGNIRKVGETTAGDATTEEWRIDSVYDGSIRLPPGKILSRHHP